VPTLSASTEGALSAEQSTLSAEQSTLSAEPSSSAEPTLSAEPSSSPNNNQPPSKKPFVPKPPQRCRILIGFKSKQSKYNYGAARVSLNAPHAHHFQIYSTAVSSNVIAVNVTPSAIIPTKGEVNEERDMLYTIATDLECKLESSNHKIEMLASKSKSLANSLKMEKLKIR
jgi:hypothetical protein